MWSILHRNQESVLVGTAVTLVMLALLARGREIIHPVDVSTANSLKSAEQGRHVSAFADVPTDPAFYAAKWRKMATEFYAAHPIKDVERTNQPSESDSEVTLSLTDKPNLAAKDSTEIPVGETLVSTSATVELGDVKTLEQETGDHNANLHTVTPPTLEPPARKRRPFVGYPAVASALAAGVLAFIGFRTAWPSATQKRPGNTAPPSFACAVPDGQTDLLRIELPAKWVRHRPTVKQRMKSLVLATSYLSAGIAAWAIVGQ